MLTILTTLREGRSAAARLVQGELDDLLVDPPVDDPAPRPGAIYRGVVGRPMKGLGGAMVELGRGRTGFLRDARGLAPGRPVIVQVTGWAEPHKAPPVARRLLLKGRFAILSPEAPGLNLARSTPPEERARLEGVVREAMAGAPEHLGLVLRSAAIDAPEEAVLGEIARLRAEYFALDPDGPPEQLLAAPSAAEEALRDWPDPGPGGVRSGSGAFEQHGVWDAIETLRRPLVPLPAGAGMLVEQTHALAAIDVNTGGDTSPAAALKANLAAARLLPRQLRLRGIGGVIAIDFAPLARHERQRVTDALKTALARDGIATTIAGWTPLGLLEISRKRARRPLTELLQPG